MREVLLRNIYSYEEAKREAKKLKGIATEDDLNRYKFMIVKEDKK